ncbi:MAG: hypothetical protein KatS3mg110_1901 [Pirellulaceae bacterium]|nr:MAG: hypothetical protein KatS3mg110_1901 [Pirellulaceae bacterium]
MAFVRPKGGEGVTFVRPKGGEGVAFVRPNGKEGGAFVGPKGGDGVSFVRPKGLEGVVFVRPKGGEGEALVRPKGGIGSRVFHLPPARAFDYLSQTVRNRLGERPAPFRLWIVLALAKRLIVEEMVYYSDPFYLFAIPMGIEQPERVHAHGVDSDAHRSACRDCRLTNR